MSVKTWRKATKKRMATSFGSCCGLCGYNKCIEALEFHHIDNLTKSFSLSSVIARPKKWDDIIIELRKCVLLCANCHREVHYNISKIPDNITRFNEEYANYRILEGTSHYCSCGKEISINKVFCLSCCKSDNYISKLARHRQITDWQKEKENIIKLKDVDKLSYVAIAKIYETSDKTIAKWYKKFK